jgi:hypothetical protein
MFFLNKIMFFRRSWTRHGEKEDAAEGEKNEIQLQG